VGDQHDRHALAAELVEVVEAAPLELLVADRDDLVHDQDLRVQVHRDREAQPDVHARRVDLDRGVDELLEPAEGDDLVHRGVDLLAGHAQDRAVEIDVVAPGHLGVEAGTEFQHRGDAAVRDDRAVGRPVDTGDQLEQGRLARTVVPDEREGLAPGDVQADALEGPEVVVALRARPTSAEDLLDVGLAVVVAPEALGDVADLDRDVGGRLLGGRLQVTGLEDGHSSSLTSADFLWKNVQPPTSIRMLIAAR
jgi:hypothetical protein